MTLVHKYFEPKQFSDIQRADRYISNINTIIADCFSVSVLKDIVITIASIRRANIGASCTGATTNSIGLLVVMDSDKTRF